MTITPKHVVSSYLIASCLLFVSTEVSATTIHSKFSAVPSGNQSYMLVSSELKAQEAKKMIEIMGETAVSFLGNTDLTTSQKEKVFRKILDANFDMRTIGRFVMGRNWKSASDQQKNEYQKLFKELVVKVYSERFGEYKGQDFQVDSVRSTGKSDFLVTSYIVPNNGSKAKVDWRVRDKNGKMKVIDIIIEGVSMTVTQRSEFASIIQRGGGDVEVLLTHLRN